MKNNLKTIGIIDIGSNSVRLLVTNGVFFNKKLITTRLAENKSSVGDLNLNSVYRTVNAILEFKELALKSGAQNIYAFATEAVRAAKNKDYFLELVKKATGLTVDVLSGELEAEIGLLGANLGEDGSIIDIGGASTEIAVQKGGKIVYKKSVPLGAVTLKDKALNKGELIKFVDGIVSEFKGAPVFNVKAIGGTSTALATVDKKLEVYNELLTDGHYITALNLSEICEELFSLTPAQIFNKYAVTKSRAEVISGGAYILLSIINALKLDGVTVSEKDNLEGYFYKKIQL